MKQYDEEEKHQLRQKLDAQESARRTAVAFNSAIGLIGAAVGGIIGYFAFAWIVRQGLYAIILPGTLLGVGCGLLLRRQSVAMGVICGILGLALGVFTEWRFFPFAENQTLVYFLAHLYDLRPISIILIALGGLFAAWFGRGRDTPYKL